MITQCIEVGYKPLKGADHDRPVYHFRLAPGKAWKIDDSRRDHEVVDITEKMSREAKDQYVLRFINGKTVATFAIGDDLYAQPVTAATPTKTKRAAKSAPAAPVEAPAGPKVMREAPRREAPRRRAPLGLL